MPVEATCWVGVDLPGAPKNVCWVQDGDIARLTWEAPTEGQHGGYMDSSGLKYNVSVGNSLEPICDAVTGFSAEFQPVLENPQDALQFNVWAVNESGTGQLAGRTSRLSAPRIPPRSMSRLREPGCIPPPGCLKLLKATMQSM